MAPRERVVERPLARLDIADHYDYLSDENMRAAEAYLVALEKTYEILLRAPESARLVEFTTRVDGLRMRALHGFPSLLLFYIPRDSGIEVVRLLHGARDIPAALEYL